MAWEDDQSVRDHVSLPLALSLLIPVAAGLKLLSGDGTELTLSNRRLTNSARTGQDAAPAESPVMTASGSLGVPLKRQASWTRPRTCRKECSFSSASRRMLFTPGAGMRVVSAISW